MNMNLFIQVAEYYSMHDEMPLQCKSCGAVIQDGELVERGRCMVCVENYAERVY